MTAPALASPDDNAQIDTLRPTLTVRNATADQTGTRVYEFQISDNSNFTAASASNVAGFAATVSKTGVPEGSGGTTSFTVEQDLQPTTLFYWRARAVQGTSTGPWSATARLKSKLVGFNRPGELYDPLIHGETVGELVGSTTFIPGKGIQLNNGQSHVKYLLPQTITNGEFSMDVEGLRPNAPGDKSKVFGMQEGQSDFITNRYRVDIQYRGNNGAPPNAITFRALYGSADDLDVRYEPDTDDAVQLGVPPQPVDHLPLEGDVGQRVPCRRARGWGHRQHDLQLRRAIAGWRVRAKSVLRVSWRARRTQRQRGGVDCRHDLSQRLALESATPGDRSAAPSAEPEPSERLCYSDRSRMFRRQFLIGVGATLVTAQLRRISD